MHPSIEQVVRDCAEANWDGHGAAPVNPLSAEWAGRLLNDLPAGIAVPEIGVAPDGDVVLEWIGNRKHVLSINVGPDGEIHFAMRGPTTKLTGKEAYTGGLPPALAGALAAVGSLPHN
jgi:hypothetical protein